MYLMAIVDGWRQSPSFIIKVVINSLTIALMTIDGAIDDKRIVIDGIPKIPIIPFKNS